MTQSKTSPAPTQLKILFFNVFINITGFAIIIPLFPALLNYYFPENGVDNGIFSHLMIWLRQVASQASPDDPIATTAVFFGCFLGALYGFLQFIFAPIWGHLSDYFGRKIILKITMAGTVLAMILWVFSGTFEILVISRVLAGVMAGSLAVANASVADITSKQNRTKGMAVFGIAFGLGFLIGPAIGGILTQFSPLTYFPQLESLGINPFSAAAALSTFLWLGNLIWIHYKFPETLAKNKRSQELILMNKGSFIGIFCNQKASILRTNLTNFVFMVAFSGMEFTLPFLAADRFNFKSHDIGYLFLYIGFILILTQGMIVRRLAPIVGERNLCFLGILSGIVSLMVTGVSYEFTPFLIGTTFLALSIGLISPSIAALVSLYSTESEQGKDIGILRSAGALARASGPIVAAFLYFYMGAKMTYVSASLILIIPLALILTLPKPDKNEVLL